MAGVVAEVLWVKWVLGARPGVVPGGSTYLNWHARTVGVCEGGLANFWSYVGQ